MAKRKITLKNKGGDSLYPRTTAQVVEVNASENLTQFLAGILNGTKTVGKAASATNADNADKLEGSTKEQILLEADTAAGVAAGNALTSANNYTDTKVASIKPIDPATTGAVGTVRLATQKEVDDGEVIDNIPTGSNPDEPAAVVVTPMALAKKLENYASLDETGKVPSSQLPSYVDDVLEFANKASFPTTGEGSKIYIDLATNKVYRWGGSTYVEVSSPLAIGETTGTAYDGGKGKANADDISALQTRVGIAESGISTINGDITNLKEKDTSHDNSITAINNALYGSGDARKFVTLAEFNPVKIKADDVPTLVTWKNQVSQRTEIDGEIVSVFAAVADGLGNDIAATYAKQTELINLTYSDDGEVTY